MMLLLWKCQCYVQVVFIISVQSNFLLKTQYHFTDFLEPMLTLHLLPTTTSISRSFFYIVCSNWLFEWECDIYTYKALTGFQYSQFQLQSAHNIQEIMWPCIQLHYLASIKFLEYQRKCMQQRSWMWKVSTQGFEERGGYNSLYLHYTRHIQFLRVKKCILKYTVKYSNLMGVLWWLRINKTHVH